MEKQAKLSQSMGRVALVTGLLLLIPLVAMQFTQEVNWSAFDFIIMGTLLFSTGLTFVFIVRNTSNILYKAATTIGIGTTFLIVWANLAVGLIGSGPNTGNIMYMSVVAVFIVGIYLSHFTAKGMEFTMFASALAVILITVIALLTNMQHYPGSSVVEVIGVGLFFTALYAISGLLFRFIAQSSATT